MLPLSLWTIIPTADRMRRVSVRRQDWIRKVSALLLVTVVVLLTDLGSNPEKAFSQTANEPAYDPNSILVKPKASASEQDLMQIEDINGTAAEQTIPDTSIEVVEVPDGSTVQEAVQRYEASADVEYAEPNYKLYPSQAEPVASPVTPNDPDFYLQWGLDNTGEDGSVIDADIDAPEAWAVTTGGSENVVAVIDTGVDISHPDLQDNIWTNLDEIPNNGEDDDGNGYVDDVNGWDFANNDNTVYDPADDPAETETHGTHVAGIIAAEGNNGFGATGVNWRTKIMPLKFIAPGQGTTSQAIAAIKYAIAEGAKISNNSYGCYYPGDGPDCYSRAFEETLREADEAGHLFVTSVGNSASNVDTAAHYPSGYDVPNIISVAATDENDNLWELSNYGALSVDLAAPGNNIWSTVPGGFEFKSGTSMAAPHVTGVAALVQSRSCELSHLQIKDRILRSVDTKDSLQGKMATGGRLNAAGALVAPPDETAPTVTAVRPRDGSPSVLPGNKVEATFSEAMQADTLNAQTFTLVRQGSDAPVPATVTYDKCSRTAVLTPEVPLENQATYAATVRGGENGAKDRAGNPLAQDKTWAFTIADTVPPDPPVILDPPEGTYDTDGKFTVAGTAEPGSMVDLFESEISRGTVRAGDAGAWSMELTGVADGTHSYTAKATDVAGNTSEVSGVRTLTVDAAIPTVAGVSPADGAKDVLPEGKVEVTFSEPIDAGTVDGSTLRLVKQGETASVAATVNYVGVERKATLTTSSRLAYSTAYTATVKGGAYGVKDVAGNPLAADKAWSFTTAPEDKTAPNTSITSGPDGYAPSKSVSFGFSSSEPRSTFLCRIDWEQTPPSAGDPPPPFESCESPKNYSSLGEGLHMFEVKAVDYAGNVDSTPATKSFFVDSVAPTVSAPAQSMVVPSTLSVVTLGYSLPVRISWSGSDGGQSGSGITKYELQRSVDGGGTWSGDLLQQTPVSPGAGGPATSTTLSATLGTTYRFRVRGQDVAGNWSAWTEGSTSVNRGYNQSHPSVTYPAGAWTRQDSSAAYAGDLKYDTANGARARFAFTGREVAWVAPKGPNRGKAEVWVDGTRVTTVDLYSSTTQQRAVVFRQAWATSGSHVVAVVLTGTKNASSTSTRVDVDAFVTEE